ncbi:MAG: single-stranded DNA-binding protein, partial [Planctomycetota bacterium]
GRTAEIASQYLGKGSPILVEGRLKLDTWETDGQKRSKLHVVGERMQMLGGRSSGASGSSGNTPSQEDRGGAEPSTSPVGPPDDEIPF